MITNNIIAALHKILVDSLASEITATGAQSLIYIAVATVTRLHNYHRGVRRIALPFCRKVEKGDWRPYTSTSWKFIRRSANIIGNYHLSNEILSRNPQSAETETCGTLQSHHLVPQELTMKYKQQIVRPETMRIL